MGGDVAVGAVKQWASEKRGLAEDLDAALTALVGDVETLFLTRASLSWRTASGVQGHWREEGGQFWLGRIVTDRHGAGTQSEQLVLTLDRVGEAEERVGLAHPASYAQRSTEGLVLGYDLDTPPIYQGALSLLTQLGVEVRTMVPTLPPLEEGAA